MWRFLDNCSSGAVCMVLASEYYDAADYYRDREEFLAAVRKGKARLRLKANAYNSNGTRVHRN